MLRWTYAVGFVVFAIRGDVAIAARLLITTALVFFARWLSLPRLFDLGFVVAMALQGWGNALDLFNRWPWYDVPVHFTLSCWVAPLLYISLARLSVVPDLTARLPGRHLVGIVVVTFALGLATGALYELYEWTVNHLFGPTLYVSYGDTIGDLGDDALGALVGGLVLALWATRGWATTRRLPAAQTSAR